MRLNITIDGGRTVHVIPVGDGKKPVRWLGVVAAQRYRKVRFG